MRVVATATLAVSLLAPLSMLSAQVPVRPTEGFDLTAHAVWSRMLDDSPENTMGVGVGLAYRFPTRLAIELRGSYRSWERETYAPLHLGLRYDLPVSPFVTLAPFAGVGPSLVMGNDWASIFASVDVGTRVYLSFGKDAKARASFGAAYGRAMAFHPSDFGVFNLTGGLSIRL